MIRYATFTTRLGAVYATLEGDGLTGIHFEGGRHAPQISPAWKLDADAAPLVACRRQLDEYLAGSRRAFELPLAPRGTPFQVRVWDEIARIPFGATLTYSRLAERIAAPHAVRAAGAATGRNPLSIIVPCHRVVGSGGSLTGYAGGLERKLALLELEGALQPALA
ncbi:MAG TPA: methylated-DNA--[protein]-cysteine S-methyltransferase [Usitatibacter sp.]|nr:methylated-DNA--[protein]-cysteine S-methyltransferase [Usitatibacter sp.]